MKSQNPNNELCKQCKGFCCKLTPGLTIPQDLGNNLAEIEKRVRELLKTDKWVIRGIDTRIEIDDEEYEYNEYLCVMPARKSNNRECIFLTDAGCSLSYKNRPYMCRELIPDKTGNCYYPDSIDAQWAATEWELSEIDLAQIRDSL